MAMHRAQSSAPAPLLAPGALDRIHALRLDDSAGRSQGLLQWKQRALVINFWAPWCLPCREELPVFSRLQLKHAASVQFVGITLDTADNVAAFARQAPVSYPLLVAGAEGTALAQVLGNAQLVLPFTVVLSAGGIPRLVRTGRLREDELDTVLNELPER